MKLVCKICGKQYESENPYSVACKECQKAYPNFVKQLKERKVLFAYAFSEEHFLDFIGLRGIRRKIWELIVILGTIGFIVLNLMLWLGGLVYG